MCKYRHEVEIFLKMYDTLCHLNEVLQLFFFQAADVFVLTKN